MSDLARQALTAPVIAPGGFHEADAAFDACDWPSFPGRSGLVVTHDQIKRIEHELDLEDAGLQTASASDHRTARAPRKLK